jgi:hypothetical protein
MERELSTRLGILARRMLEIVVAVQMSNAEKVPSADEYGLKAPVRSGSNGCASGSSGLGVGEVRATSRLIGASRDHLSGQ